jgi:hypothetical protein
MNGSEIVLASPYELQFDVRANRGRGGRGWKAVKRSVKLRLGPRVSLASLPPAAFPELRGDVVCALRPAQSGRERGLLADEPLYGVCSSEDALLLFQYDNSASLVAFVCDCVQRNPIRRRLLPGCLIADAIRHVLGKEPAGCAVSYGGRQYRHSEAVEAIPLADGGEIELTNQYDLQFHVVDPATRAERRMQSRLHPLSTLAMALNDAFPELGGDVRCRVVRCGWSTELQPGDVLYSRCSAEDVIELSQRTPARTPNLTPVK